MRCPNLLACTMSLAALSAPGSAQCSSQLSIGGSGITAVSHGDVAFFAGGWTVAGTPTSRVDVFAGSTGTWRQFELSEPRSDIAGVSVGNYVLFAGGSSADGPTTTVDILDATTGQRLTGQLSQARDSIACAAGGGKAMFAGGQVMGPSVATVDVFDAASGTWTVDALSVARFWVAGASVGNKLLFAGGRSGGLDSDVVDIYDDATGTWSTATLSSPAIARATTTLGSRALFVDNYGHIDVYDAAIDQWWTARLSILGSPIAAATAGGTALFLTIPQASNPYGLRAEFLTAELPAPFCFGDGSGTACPCSNPGAPGAGCANSAGTGATMRPFASQCAESDDMLLFCSGLVPNQPVVLFAGDTDIAGGAGAPLGDGLLCAGGNVARFPVVQAPASGDVNSGYGLQDDLGWGPGDTRRLQVWYRDPAGPCGSGFNTSNGVEVSFLP